jgi:hypothetical protein
VEAAEVKRQLASILEDQTRMRANIRELPANSEIHKRLLKKFDEQETQIEKYSLRFARVMAGFADGRAA